MLRWWSKYSATLCRTASRNTLFSSARLNETINVNHQPFVRVNDHGNDVEQLYVDDDTRGIIDNSDLLTLNQDVMEV